MALTATALVGRDAELARLRDLFAGGHRLVTLTGPGGIGKTALARACAGWADERPWDAAWTCELHHAVDPDGLCDAVARALQVPRAPATSQEATIAALAHALAARGPCLLVLDNFEQLVASASAVVARWHAAAPELRILVTSRERLRVAGEQRLDIPPLSLPGSVELFVARVRAHGPDFTLDAASEPAVAEVARRLEGIPLAIELAASHLEILGLAGLLAGLQAGLDLETRERASADHRTTLRATIEWSWNLLDPTERAVLALCALFRGGFSVAAAHAVLGPVDATRPLTAVLHALVDKSVLRSRPADGLPGHVRFTLFEVIREFAADKLADLPDHAAARARHATFYLAAGETWAAAVDGRDGPVCLRHLALERDNLLGVHHDALAAIADATPGAADRALRSALVLDALAAVQGPLAPHLELLDRALAATEFADVAPRIRVRVLRARGRARLVSGHGAAALRDLERALAGARDDPALHAAVLTDIGVHHHRHRRDFAAARAAYAEALALARLNFDQQAEGRALGNLAALCHDERALDAARGHYHSVLELVRETGNRRLEAVHVANLGVLEQECGRLDRARAHLDVAIDLLHALGERRHAAIVASNRATLDHEVGALAAARSGHEHALGLLREVGDTYSEALCLSRLGRVTAALGWPDDARACIAAAERLLSGIADPIAHQVCHVDRGFVALAEAAAAVGPAREALLAVVRARIADARGAPAPGEAAWIDRSDDIRAAVRLLERASAALGPTPAEAEGRSGPTLLLGPDARWFQPPEGPPQDFQRRGALRRILLCLVRRQREDPGVGLSLAELLAVGWPAERVLHDAGANRVYVALATLRRMGLRRHLLSRDDGYLLDPALAVVRADDPAPPPA